MPPIRNEHGRLNMKSPGSPCETLEVASADAATLPSPVPGATSHDHHLYGAVMVGPAFFSAIFFDIAFDVTTLWFGD